MDSVISEEGTRKSEKAGSRFLKAAAKSIVVGIILWVLWLFLVRFFSDYLEYLQYFTIFAWTTVFFTFGEKLTEGTIYRYGIAIARDMFVIVFFIFATDSGTITVDLANISLTVGLLPLLALIVFISLLSIAKDVTGAIDFASENSRRTRS